MASAKEDTTAATAATAATPLSHRRLRAGSERFQLVEVGFRSFHAITESGTPIENVLKPEFWHHFSSKIRQHDRIYVDAEDFAYSLELICTGKSALAMSLAALRVTTIDAADIKPPAEEFMAKHMGAVRKWCIVLAADPTKIKKEGFSSQMAAVQHIAENAKTLAARK